MRKFVNKIICGDCIEVLSKVRKPFADLIFADPPFNIGYKYDKYDDKQKHEIYVAWTKDWMTVCKKALKPHGSFYIAMADEYVADVKHIADGLKLEMRNWLIWHYTFGQQMKKKFARSHTHILYFVKNEKEFTFNEDDEHVRVLSDRQLFYNDKRANPAGKLPDDVWDGYPRVCGTFKERTGWHPCQMPESLLARIIRVSSNERDWVLDPFSGSGTTPVVAAKLNRRYTGIEISEEYVSRSRERIGNSKDLPVEGEGARKWTEQMERELRKVYHETKVSTEKLSEEREVLVSLTARFNRQIREIKYPFQPVQVIRHLIQMRKSGKLGPLRTKRRGTKEQKANVEKTLW